MKAIQVENPGASYALKLGDAEKPRPGAGEVVIKVAAAGLQSRRYQPGQRHVSAAARRLAGPGDGRFRASSKPWARA